MILFNLCGHGHFDMQAYDDYLNGRLPEVEFDRSRGGRRAGEPAGGLDPGLRGSRPTPRGSAGHGTVGDRVSAH